MNTLLLHPSDVLFFRDGRPMSGSLSGHGAAWPLPTVLSSALHAALWRSQIPSNNSSETESEAAKKQAAVEAERKFGSLLSVGPFPEYRNTWYFPKPADANKAGSVKVTSQPYNCLNPSSLPNPLTKIVANTLPPSKEKVEPWWSKSAWEAYLKGDTKTLSEDHFISDADFCDSEFTYGIGIDPERGTQNGTQFYSASYLRLKPEWRLACLAEAKEPRSDQSDLIKALFCDKTSSDTQSRCMVVGGQQRVCTATLFADQVPNLPLGPKISGNKVKWILLTPAIFPRINQHPGGYLPSWINHEDGSVQLLDGPGKNAAKRRNVAPGKPIQARLVAALVGKPVSVTGFALPHETTGSSGGAKPTYLAVPAGSVYYFECPSDAEAQKLAAALNWNGAHEAPQTIHNRRSTLFGEKGFGIGICSSWNYLA